MRKSRMPAVSAALVFLISCAPGEVGWSGTVLDSAGVSIVTNSGEGLWKEQERWRLEETLRIGETEGDAHYVFGLISSVAIDSRGSIFVLDAQAQHVRAFDSVGTYIRTMGGPGAGPGELGPQAVEVFVGERDTLYVPDIGNRRITRYDPNGRSAGSYALDLSSLPVGISATRSGLQAIHFAPQFGPDRQFDTLATIVLVGHGGVFADTILRFPAARTVNFERAEIFSPEPLWCLMEDGRVCYGSSSEYSIQIYSPQGALERIIRKPHARLAIPPEDERAIRSRIEENARNAGAPAAALARLRSFVQFAEYYPAITAVRQGASGTLWVQPADPPPVFARRAATWATNWDYTHTVASSQWDVFDPLGRFLGQVTMPPGFVPHVFAEESIYGVLRGELDEDYLVRLRIVRGAG